MIKYTNCQEDIYTSPSLHLKGHKQQKAHHNFRFRCQNLIVDGGTAGAFPEYCDTGVVSTEVVDVSLHPTQSHRLVLEAKISRHHRVLRRQETCSREISS